MTTLLLAIAITIALPWVLTACFAVYLGRKP